MPYKYPTNIPQAINALPAEAQKIWIRIYNNAYEQYKDNPERERLASSTAWAGLKLAGWKKQGDKWVKDIKKLSKLTKEAVKTIEFNILSNIHQYIHDLWKGTKYLIPEKEKEQRILLKKVHDIIVGEYFSRGSTKHTTLLEKAEGNSSSWDYLETFRNLYPWQIENAGNIVRILQEYYCRTVLDVGCGMGWLLALLKGHFEPTGIEPSENLVEYGQRNQFNVYQGYGEALPFVDHLFDGVITNQVLQYVENPSKIINECARVSKYISIHIIPLGKRTDPMHINEYETIGEFRELGEKINYPTKFIRTIYNNAIAIVSKIDYQTTIFKDYSDITLISDYISEIISSKTETKQNNVDIEIKSKEENLQLEEELTNRMKKKAYNKTNFVYRTANPIGKHLPLYDLVLKSKEVMLTKENAAEKEPLWQFVPPNPTDYQIFLQKDADIAEMWEDYCEEKQIVAVDLQQNGFRMIIEKNKDGKTLIFFDENQEDRSKQFPLLVKEMEKIKNPFIFDCNFGVIGVDGKRLSTNDLQDLKKTENIVEEEYISAKNVKGNIHIRVFDVLYYEKSVAHLDWFERRKILDSLPFGNLSLLSPSVSVIVRSKDEFVSVVKEYLKHEGSEGIVVKDLTGQYVGFGENNRYWIRGIKE